MRRKFSFKGEFLKNVATLMTGTIAAQLFTVAVSPILTRIYTPADFGVLAVFTALNAVLAIIAAAQYETAIMLPEDDSDALNIVVLSAAITLGVCGLLQGGLFIFAEEIYRMTHTPLAGRWIHLLPLSVALTTGLQIMIYWNNRGKRFRQLSITRAIHGFSTGVSQCALGYGPGGSISLVVGNVVGRIFSVVALVKMNRESLHASQPFVSFATIKKNAKEYRRFPLFLLWGALFNSSASQVPLFVIASFFSTSITGLFGFTIKVLSLPLFLISGAVSEVLYQKITQLDHAKPVSLRGYIVRIFMLLGIISLPFCLLFMAYGAEIFAFVFGEDWRMAGEFAGPLSIVAGARFMVSPLSVVLNLNHNVTKGVGWQVSYFLTLTSVLLLCAGESIGFLLWAYVAHEVVMYGAYFAVIIWASKHPHSDNNPMSLGDADGTVCAKATSK